MPTYPGFDPLSFQRDAFQSVRVYACVAGGGATSGGASVVAYARALVASGGAVAGGAAIEQRAFAWVAVGGAVAGGSAGMQHALACVAAGGAVAGGVATLARSLAAVASGGAVSAGAAILRRSLSWATSGGAVAGGIGLATFQKIYALVASGGGVGAGAAVVVYINAPNVIFDTRVLLGLADFFGGAADAGADVFETGMTDADLMEELVADIGAAFCARTDACRVEEVLAELGLAAPFGPARMTVKLVPEFRGKLGIIVYMDAGTATHAEDAIAVDMGLDARADAVAVEELFAELDAVPGR